MLSLLLVACLAAPSDDPVVNFEHLWTLFDERYGGFSQRGVDWDQAYADWRPMVSEQSDDDALFEAISGMLATLDDGHVRLLAPDRPLFSANADYRDQTMAGTFDEEVVRTYLTDVDTGPWDWYLRGDLGEGVAYVWFPGIDDNTWVLESIVADDPAALIIDLRHSGGGAFTYALRGLAPIFAVDTPTCLDRSRNGPERDDFDDWFTWIQPAGEDPWTGPVLVLVDAMTISASERVLMALDARPNTTLIGVPSNGSLATSVGGELPNGWYLQYPVQETMSPAGEVWEGVGVPMDDTLLNDPEVLRGGVDEVLEFARARAVGG